MGSLLVLAILHEACGLSGKGKRTQGRQNEPGHVRGGDDEVAVRRDNER
jgi:hypothetical protein